MTNGDSTRSVLIEPTTSVETPHPDIASSSSGPGGDPAWPRWLPLAILLLGAIAMTLPMVWGGVRLGQDSATQFYPWYHNLGERLRAGGVPEWNPYQFSGAPLAADPQSGWMYLPAMLAFTLLPFGAAIVAQIFGHLLLASLGLWLLARRLGLGNVAALVVAVSYAGSGVLLGRIPSGPASYEVLSWLPWVLLGAELAVRSRTWSVRIAAWGLTGLAVSQALAAWVGQVSYYTLLLLGAWVAYRVLWGGTDRDGDPPASGRWAAVLLPVRSLADLPQEPPTSGRTDLIATGQFRTVVRSVGVGLASSGPPQRPSPAGETTLRDRMRTNQRHGSAPPAALRGEDGARPAPTRSVGASQGRADRPSPSGVLPTITLMTIGRLVVHGLVMVAIGLGLSAAGLLPRLEFNAVSNASGGEYATAIGGVIGGSTSETVIGRLFQPSLYYPGVTVLALAVVGILLGRGRFALPFWLVTAVCAIILTVPAETPLHRLLYLLPQFRQFHEHWPERVILIAFPGLALMAGAGAQALVDGGRVTGGGALRVLAIALPPVILAGFAVGGGGVSGIAVAGVLAVMVVSVVALFGWPRMTTGRSASAARWGRRGVVAWLPAALVLIVAADLLLMNEALAGQAPFGGFHRRDLDAYYAPSGAAAFLQERSEAEGPFRFAGYDPALGVRENGQTVLYRYQFGDPRTQELAVNNRATLLGLQDVQGYNPLQVARYVDLVAAMNGTSQEYHGSDVLPGGLGSPLLDLLGVRYLIVRSAAPADPSVASWATVYDDGATRVIENPEALPRLWAVTGTTTVPAGEALPLLASGQVDPRTTAVFEEGSGPAPPALPAPGASPDDPPVLMLDRSDDPDTLRFTASVATDTVVVLSEVAYPAWRATIDGQPVDLLTADHALRAVVVPAGQHEVILRYDSAATRIGMAISLVTLLIVVAAWLVAHRRTGTRRPARVAQGRS